MAGRVIARPRLNELLRRRWTVPLTEIIGGPGLGKTTALAVMVRDNERSPVGADLWLTCEPADEDPSHLVAGLAHAVGISTPRLDIAAVALTDALARASPVHQVVVVDDLHHVPEGPSAALLADVLELLPATAHLVLSSRRPSPFPTNRLVAAGDAVLIDEAALRFDAAELSDLAGGKAPIAERLSSSGGWPAIAALAVAGHDPSGYLWEEVLSSLTADQRRLMATVVLLGSADQGLIGAAFGHDVDVGRVLDVPLVFHDGSGGMAVHPLWAAPLARELDRDERDAARRRAVAWLVERGDAAAAFELLDLEADWELAQPLLIDACGARYRVSTSTLATWSARIPPSLADEPTAQLLRATVSRWSRPWSPEPLGGLVAAADRFRDEGDTAGEWAALQLAGDLAFTHDDVAGMATLVARGQKLLDPSSEEARWWSHLWEAFLAFAVGDYAGAISARHVPDGVLPTEWTATAHRMASTSALLVGDLDLAVDEGEEAAARASESNYPSRIAAPIARWLRGDPGSGEAMLTELAAAAVSAPPASRHRSWLFRAMNLGLAGRTAEARDAVERVDTETVRLSGLDGTLHAMCHAVIGVAIGDEDGARRSLDAALEDLVSGSLNGMRALIAAPAVVYVLLPEVRPVIDEWGYGGSHAVTLEVARAFAPVHDGVDEGAVATVPWPTPERLAVMLPRPWLLAWAVAGRAGHVAAADGLLDRLAADDGAWFQQQLRALETHPVATVARTARDLLKATPVAPREALAFRGLGGIHLERGGIAVDDRDWRRERVRMLLALLIERRSARRTEVADLLWPDLDAHAAENNLAVTLSYLLRVLEPDRPRAAPAFIIRTEGAVIRLVPADRLAVDGWHVEETLDAAEEDDRDGRVADALDRYSRALEGWGGDWLEEVAAEWPVATRERLRARLVHAAVRAGELHLAAERTAQAVALADRALQREPWSEPAYRLLVASHVLAGDRAAARRAAQRCRAMLDDLGVEPEAATEMTLRSVALRSGTPPSSAP